MPAQVATEQIVYRSPPTDLLAGSVQTFVVYDKKRGGRPLESLMLVD